MGVDKGERFATGDVFINYPFEEVMFRWDHAKRRIFRKFYGGEEEPIQSDNRLFNDALLYGDEVSREEYYE